MDHLEPTMLIYANFPLIRHMHCHAGSRQQGTADGAASTDANQAPASAPVSAPAANPAATQGEPIAATASDAAADTQTPSTAAAPPAAVPAAAPAAAVSQPDLPTQTQPQNSAATPQTEGSAAANQDQRGTGPVTEPTSSTSAQRRSAQRSARSGTEAPSGGRNALDGGRRQRRRGPTISPSVTMALGVLLHEMQQTTAFTDSFGVLNRSAAALERTYSYEGTHLQDVLVSLSKERREKATVAP